MKTKENISNQTAVVIGGGFTGLAAALELAKKGIKVRLLEKDTSVGGLAGGFNVGGQSLEKFYHHWFVSDSYVMDLVKGLGLEDNIVLRPTRTGMYYANNFYRLSTPLDLLRFTPLGFLDRLRLGWGTLRVRSVRDWRALEDKTAREWLIELFGRRVFTVVWEPLLVGKFGAYANDVSAVWFWKKIVLRGGSRGQGGKEILAYYRGGFAALAQAMADKIIDLGGEVQTDIQAIGLDYTEDRISAVVTNKGTYETDACIVTTPFPVIADLFGKHVPEQYADKLRRIRYLGNVCLVLLLSRSLSDTYWLNVNDPSFPFVGIIEHTNFEPASSYEGKHVVYLSKYLSVSDRMYAMSPDELLEYSLPHIQKMFPLFDRSWIISHHLWRAEYAQPIAEKHYSKLLPGSESPLGNVFISTMAQVYPEDRGTNYAIREGRRVASLVITAMKAGR